MTLLIHGSGLATARTLHPRPRRVPELQRIGVRERTDFVRHCCLPEVRPVTLYDRRPQIPWNDMVICEL